MSRVLEQPVAPCVVKLDGLAAGKGVFVCWDDDDLRRGLEAARTLGGDIVVEELLEGAELSVFALVDGHDVFPLGAARDYSRLGDGDLGPNTGGMGSYTPVADAPPVDELVDEVHRPVVEELARRGAPFVGCLYAGLVLTDDGVRVLEFNCRFGDPETQVLLPALGDDLLPALAAAANGELTGVSFGAGHEAALTVALAAPQYPERGDTGTPIHGVADAEATGALVFHAGTALAGRELVTNGGRILNVTGTAASVSEARERAYAGVERISFPGARYRTDIGAGVAERARA
jgi:phosphoribosylamine---glycine ligase